ncbi:hypothetical protein J1N35_042699 [Gossypium stocksii]|uniref:Uncharacterized protein n=1 Tax=Gossypium stocksii TaxID=47602 RepID=A0A9D3U604_9ROSI|nr:hypothetical protein J1N35_042699 [Gossypium stocksii]
MNVEEMQGVFFSTNVKLTKRNNALEALMMTLKEETEAMLKGELVIHRVVVGKGMLGRQPNWHHRSTDERRGGTTKTWVEF